jgi:hypothetical protein
MALAFVAERHSSVNNTGSTSYAKTISGVSVGSLLVVVVGCRALTNANPISGSGVTDNGSTPNTWTTNTQKAAVTGSITGCGFAAAYMANAPTVVTINVADVNAMSIKILEFSGADTSSPAGDQNATASSAPSVSSMSVGATGATTLAAEVAIAAVAIGASAETSFTPGGSYSQAGAITTGTSPCLAVEYLILSSTGTQTATGSWSPNANSYAAVLQTYKAAASGTIYTKTGFAWLT